LTTITQYDEEHEKILQLNDMSDLLYYYIF